MNGFFKAPSIVNEPVYSYEPGSLSRAKLKSEIEAMRESEIEIPMIIGGNAVKTGFLKRMASPHDIAQTLGHYHFGGKAEVEAAVAAALEAKKNWEKTPWFERAAIFLRAADLIAGPYRAKVNASTMLCQSKTAHQSEIDAVCELVDFLRYNVKFLCDIYAQQPDSSAGVWNRMEYRPLEGFVFAITPFNFTAIAGNLCAAPALMGNTVVWKPAEAQIYSAKVIMDIFMEAGLPAGVINMVFADGPTTGEVIFKDPYFAGLHFTGSTSVFKSLWKTIAQNLDIYRSYPRIVGETGGKDFVLAHPTAEPSAVAVALLRGAFEFQGQKCSAASRAYLPASIAEPILNRLVKDLMDIRPGVPEDFSNFFTAVIDERSFDKIAGYIENAKKDPNIKLVSGGGYSKTDGYFIEPTVFLSKVPTTQIMCEEIFGPVLSVYVYEDSEWANMLQQIDQTGIYALTGAVFAKDRAAIQEALDVLRNAAGNFYINDKPTGAVVNQQPFGGARASGTNDKAGSALNLLRWLSPRTIKETFAPPTQYQYPFMDEE